MKSESESLFPIRYTLLGKKSRVKWFSVRRIKSDKMEFSAPRDDYILPKVLARSCFSDFKSKDLHREVLERFQAK
jgi:hypothetical protein